MKKLYLKIKQKIDDKPKLKKTLKVVGRVLTIFSVLWCIFLTICLVVGCSLTFNDDDYQLPIYAQKQPPVKEICPISNDNYIAGVDEFCNERAINLMLVRSTIYGQQNGFNALDGTWRTLGELWNAQIVAPQNPNNTFLPSSNNYVFRYDINSRDIYFAYYVGNSPGDVYGIKYWLYSYGGDDFTYLCTCYFFHYTGSITSLPTDTYFTNSNMTARMAFRYYYPGYAYPDIAENGFGYITYQMSIRDNTYEEAYENGYDVGYANGYDRGYDVGISQHPDLEFDGSNPFSLISQAFRAVGGFLNIDILPNLKLGVLIFTPIIVSIIIVVVKMIRG